MGGRPPFPHPNGLARLSEPMSDCPFFWAVVCPEQIGPSPSSSETASQWKVVREAPVSGGTGASNKMISELYGYRQNQWVVARALMFSIGKINDMVLYH